jgi:hypothetical protein
MSSRRSKDLVARRFPVRWLIGGIAIALLAIVIRGVWAQAGRPEVVVYKSATCGCCNSWVEHLRARGFRVTTHDVPDLAEVRRRLNVPERFASCHTAKVDRYVVEGHVPAREIERLLAMRPRMDGLAVPGMPIGSPGMEHGPRRDPYDVVAFNAAGESSAFATYR